MHTHEEELSQAASPATGAQEPKSPLLALQRSAGNAAVAGVLDVVGSGGGSPLDTDTRSFMEASLGHEFSSVRVHTDDSASESARSVGASAYTVGNDVVVQRDRWAPGTSDGDRLLAHELTHVIQQAAGPVDGVPMGDGVQVSDPGDRFELEATSRAEAVVQRQMDGTGEDEEAEGVPV